MLPPLPRLRHVAPLLATAALALGVTAPAAVADPAQVHRPDVAASHVVPRPVLVTGPALAVRQAHDALADTTGFTDLPLIGGFSVSATPAQRAWLVARGLTVTDDAPAHVTDADWGAGSHDASAVYPQVDGAPSAWKSGYDGHGVSVAVIDTGIDDTGDLAGKVIDGFDFSGEGDYTKDSFGHGTFVAGTIAGSGAASGGAIKGVAPGVNLVSLKVAGADGSTDLVRVIAAIGWTIAHAKADHIRVLNLSLGTDATQGAGIDPLNVAVEAAWRAGIVVTVAAGNNGAGGITSPGDDPYVITVGAADDATTVAKSDDTVASYSSTGPTALGVAKPDLVAPGNHLVSTRAIGSTVDAGHPDARVAPSYFRGSGTSFSAPQVAAAAALLLEQRPNLSNDHVKGMLTRTASALPGVRTTAQGAGELNIPALLAANPGKPANTGLKFSTGLARLIGLIESLGRGTNAWDTNAWDTNAWDTNAWDTNAWD